MSPTTSRDKEPKNKKRANESPAEPPKKRPRGAPDPAHDLLTNEQASVDDDVKEKGGETVTPPSESSSTTTKATATAGSAASDIPSVVEDKIILPVQDKVLDEDIASRALIQLGGPLRITGTITPAETTLPEDYPTELNGFSNPDGLTHEEMKHIASYATRDNPTSRKYPIAALPAGATWGSSQNKPGHKKANAALKTLNAKSQFSPSDAPKFLCLSNKPVRVTTVGEVRSFWFFTKREVENRTTVWASRWQTVRTRGDQASVSLPYQRVFDGREDDPPVKNPDLSAADIAIGDIVLLHCNVYRYPPKAASGTKNRWDKWTASLELLDIVYLMKGPELPEPEPVQDGATLTD
ncbi:uncharacterized protein PHACADRAFT_31547 [Phanerochaete carnosa HHB-10118-sp]|uniref:Uncharacterized protein n=1 Tax=Phanerochaete carnosa (strain HHB-10118-sp) TaxID=650164 RepID=K5VYP0_PHACS|nr:uncharacterized protein PHACADRAFT_31547 [Phanerochaete carnosa HHB-10118-sp]EKM51729.1 hypothetical protein PHACADRAFT_31547 [Phanerochaete carnosa HHB-10118-sp]